MQKNTQWQLALFQFLLSFGIHARADSGGADFNERNDVIYQIFVPSFSDSNHDSIGDLNGITNHLDYLNSNSSGRAEVYTLGIDALWLTPIFPSPSYHGYDAMDFKKIDRRYGTDADFERLVSESHRRGIKIFLDLAVNHVSTQGEWFKSASTNPRSEFRNFFLWRNEDPNWGGFGRWWPFNAEFFFSSFSQHMADLNWRNLDVVNYIRDVFLYWSKKGVDGFRLDAARYYVEGSRGESDTPETHDVLKGFVRDVKHDYPRTFFLGEIWAGAETIGSYIKSGDQLDSAFNFPVSGGLLASLRNGRASEVMAALRDSLFQAGNPWRLASFITNHDMVRVATEVHNDLAKLKLAATVILTLPGQPTIYYGEEIGLANSLSRSSPGDLAKRTPMQWNGGANYGFTDSSDGPWQPFSTESLTANVADQIDRSPSLLQYYQQLIRLRKHNLGLTQGSIKILNSTDERLGLYLRVVAGTEGGREFELIILNFSDDEINQLSVEVKGGGISPGNWQGESLWGQATARFSQPTSGGGTLQIEKIAPVNSSIIRFLLK